MPRITGFVFLLSKNINIARLLLIALWLILPLFISASVLNTIIHIQKEPTLQNVWTELAIMKDSTGVTIVYSSNKYSNAYAKIAYINNTNLNCWWRNRIRPANTTPSLPRKHTTAASRNHPPPITRGSASSSPPSPQSIQGHSCTRGPLTTPTSRKASRIISRSTNSGTRSSRKVKRCGKNHFKSQASPIAKGPGNRQ